VIILFGFEEGFEVGLHLVFEIVFHGDSVERRRVREGNGSPSYVTCTAAMSMTIFVFVWAFDIQVELQVPRLPLLDFAGHRVDVPKIRLKGRNKFIEK
jgi:hypothetical protein